MVEAQLQFLEILRAAIQGRKCQIPLSTEQLQEVCRIAREQYVLPMICEALYPGNGLNKRIFRSCCREAVESSVVQVIKSREILPVYKALCENGLHPLVVKGMVCRQVYLHPEERLSVDEDILIPPEEKELCCRLLSGMGMRRDPETRADGSGYEVSYYDLEKGLYLEVHTALFDPESELFAGWNTYFRHCHEKARRLVIYGTEISTLSDTDHLFYMLLHVLKHFLHSGFGIRQVCDICLMACASAGSIDWKDLRKRCGEVRAVSFVTALFQIGCQYLLSEEQAAVIRRCWPMGQEQNPELLLKDILTGGITGNSSLNRLHSSSITLQAAMGKGTGTDHLLRTIFPSAKDLAKRYPYLVKAPVLLPAAWVSRIADFLRESRSSNGDHGAGSASETVRIAHERIRLIRKYGLIPEE